MTAISDGPAQTSLLFLPALAPPVQRSSWWAAYRTTLEHALRRLRPSDGEASVRLDVAVALRHSSYTSRTGFYPEFHDIMREVYSLILSSANHVQVDLDFPAGIDARVFLIDCSKSNQSGDGPGQQQFSGPVVDMKALVAAKRSYQTIYSVHGEDGEEILKSYVRLVGQQGDSVKTERLPGGPSMVSSAERPATTPTETANHNHTKVINGGTFDHIHIGHKVLLATTVYLADPLTSEAQPQHRQITIGITGDELLVNKKYGALVESWEERQQRSAEFIESILVFHPDIPSIRTIEHFDRPGPNGKVVKISYGERVTINYTQIMDPYGPTITDESLTAIVISAETRAGGKAVNDKRTEKGWHPLEVFEIDVLDAKIEDEYKGPAPENQIFENKISSTEIRRRLEAKTKNSSGRL